MKTIPNDTFFACVEAELAEGRPVRFRLKGNSMFPYFGTERMWWYWKNALSNR